MDKITIVKKKNPFDGSPGYQVNISGRPQMVAMGEANWWPTKTKARKWAMKIRKDSKKKVESKLFKRQWPVKNKYGFRSKY